MTAVVCGEDEFGKLFADVKLKDSHSLRGLGSLRWNFEDEPDTATHTHSKDTLPVADAHGCFADATTAQAGLESSAAHCSSNCGNSNTDGTGNVAANALRSDDIETDSEDDLRIVLNPLQKRVEDECSGDDSEDDEDFVVLTGNEASGDKVWPENSLTASQNDMQARVVGGEKTGLSKEEQDIGQKHSGLHSRFCYGGQAFRRHYRYVRANAIGRVEAVPIWRAKVASWNTRYAKWRSPRGHGGFTNFYRTGAVPGSFLGPEYILPPNKTVFDVDIDAFKGKPWRLPNIDLSDYFNFELNETSWKEYCKRLAQFCSEVVTQSKINVYEGERAEQSAAGIIKAGVGQQSSSNVVGQQFRDSDAIFLINAVDGGIRQACVAGDQADIRDACKVSDTCAVIMKSGLEGNVCGQVKEQPSVKHRIQISRKKSGAALKDILVNGLQETGTVEAVSRLKTPSPATPPERLPARGKRHLSDCGVIQHRGLDLSGQVDHNFGTSRKVKETMELAQFKTTYGGQSLKAALSSARHTSLTRRKNLKRASTHTLGSQVIKKRKLDSHQANHGCRFASLLMKKFSRVHATKAISAPQMTAQTILQENGVVKNATSVFPNGNITSKNLFDGYNSKHVTETVEKQDKPINLNCENSESKLESKSKDVGGILLKAPGKSAKETASKKLKAETSDKGFECKRKMKSKHKKTKSKDKVHLPGCPNFNNGLAKNVVVQEMGKMSMISFTSKDNMLFWKMADHVSSIDTEDSNAENVRVIYNCHESSPTEGTSLSGLSETHYANFGEKSLISKKSSKRSKERSLHSIHGESEAVNDQVVRSNTLKLLSGKEKRVKFMSTKETLPAPSKRQMLNYVSCGTNMNSSTQVPIKERLTLTKKIQLFEEKGRPSVGKQLHLESGGKVLGLAVPGQYNGQRCTKHNKNVSGKTSCQKLTIFDRLVGLEAEQTDAFIKVTNHGHGPMRARKLGNDVEVLDKRKEVSSQSCRSQSPSTKMETPNGTSSTVLGKGVQKFENQVRQTRGRCPETKSFWAFSI